MEDAPRRRRVMIVAFYLLLGPFNVQDVVYAQKATASFAMKMVPARTGWDKVASSAEKKILELKPRKEQLRATSIVTKNSANVDALPFNAFGRFHIAVTGKDRAFPGYHCFSLGDKINYIPFCEDFGPMSLGSLYRFSAMVDEKLKTNPGPIAVLANPESTSMTNTVLLTGAYMILKLNMEPTDVERQLSGFLALTVPFRDVSPGHQTFGLHVRDCWDALWKAKSLKWINFADNSFDLREYEHYDNPLNADLHRIVPNKFIAMRGPKDLPAGQVYADIYDDNGHFLRRDFSPQHYARILRRFRAAGVVRLSASRYDAAPFAAVGIPLHDLFFADCTAPPPAVVDRFLALVESTPGPVAVHCDAGLGRTGTLIGVYLMKHYAFTAREAIAWLRLVRPGSVIGPQQDFLCEQEGAMRAAGEAHRARHGHAAHHHADDHSCCTSDCSMTPSPPPPTCEEAERALSQALLAAERRERREAVAAAATAPPSPTAAGEDEEAGKESGGWSLGSETLAGHVWAAVNGRWKRRLRS